MIPREIVRRIVDRTDIVDLIGASVTLKRAGANYSGLCPFHNEKTPSFTVFPNTQSFFCFGCEAGGDALTFVMRTENLEYADAVRYLAKRVGIDLPEDTGGREYDGGISRKRLYEMNADAAKWFRSCLLTPEIGKAGMDYLTVKRGLSTSVIRHFGLGYAPPGFDNLTSALTAKGYTADEMRQGFLCGISQSGKPYDKFRDRVMFPVIDTSGQVVAFSGRYIGPDDPKAPKYLNSSDTPVYQKRRNLFALNFAKNKCADELILCEGNMDVVSLHAAGFENAVASLGTALTDEQARIMTRYTKRVIISYDSDAAGVRAADRAMAIFSSVGLDVRILRMKNAKDPDEYIKKFGAGGFRRLLTESSTGFEFKLDGVLQKYDLSQPDQKIKAASELCQIIAGYGSGSEREVYIGVVSERLGISAESIGNDVKRVIRSKMREAKKQDMHQAVVSLTGLADKVNPETAGNVRAAGAEDVILGLLLLRDELRCDVASGAVSLTSDDFVTPFSKRVFDEIIRMQTSDCGFDVSFLGESFSPDEMSRLIALRQRRIVLTQNDRQVLDSAVATLKQEKQSALLKQSSSMDQIQQLLDAKRKNKAPSQ